MQDLSNGLHGCNVFSKSILSIPVPAADIPIMAIIMPFGLFKYLFTPFWLSNDAQTFQRMMDRTIFTHLLHLEAFFNALAANGLIINLEKCVFAVPSLEVLSHTISAIGSAPTGNQKLNLAPPHRHQATAMFSQHGEFLLSFFAQLRTGVAPVDCSPEREA
jgi:hypothetical protein